MPDPVIVPSVPEVHQGEPIASPQSADNSPGIEQVQEVFDRVYPDRTTSQPESPQKTDKPPESFVPPAVDPQKEQKMPSFLEEALKVERPPGAPEPESPKPAPEEDFPEELPTFKSSD